MDDNGYVMGNMNVLELDEATSKKIQRENSEMGFGSRTRLLSGELGGVEKSDTETFVILKKCKTRDLYV